MERIDFIDGRIDVVKNIYTLYSYVKGNSEGHREWALQRFKQGKWWVELNSSIHFELLTEKLNDND